MQAKCKRAAMGTNWVISSQKSINSLNCNIRVSEPKDTTVLGLSLTDIGKLRSLEVSRHRQTANCLRRQILLNSVGLK